MQELRSNHAKQTEAAARQAHDIQEDKIKLLSDQMSELMSRLDQETEYRARREEESAHLRAMREQRVEAIHIGTPPGLPEPRRESTTNEKPLLPPIFLEGMTSLPHERIEPKQDDGPPGGAPAEGPCDGHDDADDDDDDDDDSDAERRRNTDTQKKKKKKKKKKKEDKGRKESRGRRRRRRSPSSPSSSSDFSESSSSSSSDQKLDKRAVKKG